MHLEKLNQTNMKKLNLLIFLSLVSFSLMAQGSDGVIFKKDDWSAILAQAKAEDKLIFVDAFTTWCGPCKKMDRDVFPKMEVGSFYNAMFINVKIDMEKGQGIKIARDYNVTAFPTFLFIDGNGKIMHRTAGFHDVNQFIALGNEAVNPEGRLSTYEKQYQDGDRDPAFLKKYTKIRYDIADGTHDDIALEYLKTQDDWGTEENKEFLFGNIVDANSELFDYLLANKNSFADMYGQNAVMAKVQEVIYASIDDTKDDSGLAQIGRLFQKAYPDRADQMTARFSMTYYRQAGDREKYMDAAKAYYKKYKTEDQAELNETAWTFFRITKDKARLKQAVKFAKKSIKLESNYYNNDTLANLYDGLGKKRKAIKTANKAIALAEKESIDYSLTTELINKINNPQPVGE